MTHDGGVDYRGNSWRAVPSPLLFGIASAVLTTARASPLKPVDVNRAVGMAWRSVGESG